MRYAKTDDPTKFWSQVDPLGCWAWRGAKDKDGYGQTRVRQQRVKAHRRAWEITYGAIPDGMFVLHRCDNPSCVRPDHLYLGTALDNGIDRRSRKRDRRVERLSRAEVDDIRARYASGSQSQPELALEYGVHQSTISRIVLGKSYRFDIKPRSNIKR